MLWNVFCHIVDNLGDVGVCWRLANNLSLRGENVCLWLDDRAALRWMAPHGAAGIEVKTWDQASDSVPVGNVVVEAFGCDVPQAFVRAMARADRPPVWINLEYLSAEPYVERSHALPSPQFHGPGAGLTKWFFYPGFSQATGGLLREPNLAADRSAHNKAAWLRGLGIEVDPCERLVSIFCYPGAPCLALAAALAGQPTLMLLTPCDAQQQLSPHALPAGVRAVNLPWLDQHQFDRLLWSCDINFVRGEDSWVRAMWAGVPFVWHIYPQHDGAHVAKLHSFLDAMGASKVPGLHELMCRWNGLTDSAMAMPPAIAWQALCGQWRDTLAARPDLTSELLAFALSKR